MNLKEVRYILAVGETGNLSKAASQLYISQPALSKYIKNLEESQNIRLFDRLGNRLVLTQAGRVYLDAARMIVDIYEKMEQDLQEDEALMKGKIRIGMTTFRASRLLPKILPEYCQRYPNIEIQLHEESAETLEQLLAAGEVDAIIIKMPLISPHFTYIPLYQEELLLSLPPEHPAISNIRTLPGSNYQWIDLSLVSEELFILLKPGQRTRLISENILKSEGIIPKRIIQTSNIETALQLSASGLGVSFIPELYAQHSYYTTMPFFASVGTPITTSEFVLAYRKDGYLTNATRRFIDQVVRYYAKSY